MLRSGIIIFFVIFIGQVFGQKNIAYYHVLNYTSNEGLPHNLVFDMTQSEDGFIWVATNNGLGRFDGYNFKTYRPQKNKQYNISGKSITKLTLDTKQNLWLGLQGLGLNRMDLVTERFYGYFPDSTNPNAISGNDIRCVFEDSDSLIWVGTNKGLDYYDAKIDGFVNCVDANINERNTIYKLFEDFNKRIWFTSEKTIAYYDKTKGKVVFPSFFQDELGLAFDEITEIEIQDQSKLWIGTLSKGLFCYNLRTNKIDFHKPEIKSLGKMFITSKGDVYLISHDIISKLFYITTQDDETWLCKSIVDFNGLTTNYFIDFKEDQMGNVWLSSEEGLYRIDTENNVALIKSKNFELSDILKKNLTAHFIDNMGNFWLNSQRKGIIMIDLYQKQFTSYRNLEFENNILSGDNITMVFEDSRKRLWVGSYGEGITCYDRQTGQFTIIPYDASDQQKIISKAPAGVCEDLEGNIWLGFYDGGLAKIDPNSFKVEYVFGTFKDRNNMQYGHSIRSIMLDNENNLWFASNSNGLIERKEKTGEFVFHSDKYEKSFFTNSHYRFVTQTRDGIIWTGTQNGGLGRYDQEKKTFTHYKNDKNDPHSISGNTVYYVYEATDSTLWVATDKGLNQFNRNNQKFRNFQIENNGYICGVYRIYPDKENNLWLSGDCGLIKFNTKTLNANLYKQGDGLPANEFNTTAGCMSQSGEIFLGSSNGLVSFFPDDITVNPFYPKPMLTQLKIFNQNVSAGDTIRKKVLLDKELSLTKRLELPYFMNDFTIEFSAMHFASPAKNEYQYWLEGFSNEWISVNANRRWANFTGLIPGTYIFHLKATNNDGILCHTSDEVSLIIEIIPPFYRTLLFRLMVLIVGLAMIIIAFRLRFRNIKIQKQILEETVFKRTQELQNKNMLLVDRQEEISLQKEELLKHRNHLEELVEIRTNKMKLALEKAEESDRLKSAFLSNMSHEIRTPMNAILGFSSLLLEANYSDEEKTKFLEMVHFNGKTLLNLLNDIIDISIIESGQLVINKAKFNVNDLLNDIYQSFKISRELIGNDNLELCLIDNCDTPISLNTDAFRLKQILNNLISNAIKYTKKGSISVSITPSKHMLTFAVVDTGIGIDQEKLDAVFDRFRKIEDTNVELYRGGGLGLAICKNLVESMGGKIGVYSTINKGSNFYFTIPIP